jgi:hypothetical protein
MESGERGGGFLFLFGIYSLMESVFVGIIATIHLPYICAIGFLNHAAGKNNSAGN